MIQCSSYIIENVYLAKFPLGQFLMSTPTHKTLKLSWRLVTLLENNTRMYFPNFSSHFLWYIKWLPFRSETRRSVRRNQLKFICVVMLTRRLLCIKESITLHSKPEQPQACAVPRCLSSMAFRLSCAAQSDPLTKGQTWPPHYSERSLWAAPTWYQQLHHPLWPWPHLRVLWEALMKTSFRKRVGFFIRKLFTSSKDHKGRAFP